MRTIFLVGLVALSFTLALIGCGGDPCGDYQKKLCEDDQSRGACEGFKKAMAKAKDDGKAGDMKKTCETSLANWDKRGEGAGKNEEAAKKAADAMAAAKTACEGQGGTYTPDMKACTCADGKPQMIAKMDDKGKAVTKDGKKVWERSACPKAEPKKAPKPPAAPSAGAAGAKNDGKAAAPAAAAPAAAAPAAAPAAAAPAAEKAAAPAADKK